jgi:hypothetical protein
MRIQRRIENVEATLRLASIGVGIVALLITAVVSLITQDFIVLVFGFIALAGFAWAGVYVVKGMSEELEEGKPYYVRHYKSGDWGVVYGKKRVLLPGHVFLVAPLDLSEREEKVTGKLPFPGMQYEATVKWKPDLENAHQWITEGTRSLSSVPFDCQREAEKAISAQLMASVTFQGEQQPWPEWGKDWIIRLARRKSIWEHYYKIPIGFMPDLSRHGIKAVGQPMAQLIPPPPLEPWEEYDDLHIGIHRTTAGEGKQIFLDEDDRVAHMQAIGGSRYGKTKLIEYAARQLIYGGSESVVVLDPNEQFYQSLLSWCAFRKFDASYLDPSDERSQLGFNPFQIDDPTPAKIAARAKRLLETTLKAVGVTGEAAQAQRILKCLYYVVIEQGLPVTDLNAFFTPRLFDHRDQIMAACQNEEIRDQWDMIAAGKKTDAYMAMMQSSANRLFDLIADPGVQRLFNAPRVIDLKGIVDEGDVLIVNLARSPVLSVASRNVIGAFLVDEVWDILSTRSREQAKKLSPCNLIVDEFHNFSTPQFAEMLKEGAKYGLHLWLINHSLEDVEPVVRRALNACHSRFLFGGTSQKDAAAILAGTTPAYGETVKQEADAVPGLKKRVFMLTRTGKPNLWCSTPEVQEFELAPEKRDQYLAEQTRFPEDVQEEPAPTPEPRPIFPKPKAGPIFPKPEQAEQKVEQPKPAAHENEPKPITEPDDFYY